MVLNPFSNLIQCVKMLFEKRAVSEVISSLILLLIISVLGTSLYSYSLNVTNSQQNTLNQNIKNEAERAQELFKVTSVWWSRYDDFLNVTVLNYGRLEFVQIKNNSWPRIIRKNFLQVNYIVCF